MKDERFFSICSVFLPAQRMITQRRFLARFCFIPCEPAQIELPLAIVFRFEGSLLELYYNQTLEFAVIEEQINIEIVSVELNPFLAGDE